MSYVGEYLAETMAIAEGIDRAAIEALVDRLYVVRWAAGRVFVLGLGGSAANASHLAADLRMWASIRASAPESLPELTARANDVAWAAMFSVWLETRSLAQHDLVLVLSVGGGGIPDPLTSLPLITAAEYAKHREARLAAIVGEPGGMVGEMADVVVKIPTVNPERKTEHCEGWQGIIHHLIVGHPRLRRG